MGAIKESGLPLSSLVMVSGFWISFTYYHGNRLSDGSNLIQKNRIRLFLFLKFKL